MKLSILHVAYSFAPVGPRACGGAEQILTDVDRALVHAGHRSTVVACEGSGSAGRLFTAPVPRGRLDVAAGGNDTAHRAAHADYQRAIDRALATQGIDLVHMHGLDWHTWRIPEHVPTLVTLHMPVDWYPASIWRRRRANLHFQCVSAQQKLGCPDPDADVIANGVELPPYDREAFRGDYALALGRICPEKNLHAALLAGTAAGVRVLVGGQTFPYSAHMAYEAEQFRPALIGTGTAEQPQHSFLGPLEPARKQRMLAGARCLLHPTLAPETSSLVAMEALAAGTPVIAYRSGALPEVVEDGVTGFLVDDVAGMADAVRRVDGIDRDRCRAAAEARFDRDRMTGEYMRLYRTMLHAHKPAHVLAA